MLISYKLMLGHEILQLLYLNKHHCQPGKVMEVVNALLNAANDLRGVWVCVDRKSVV